MRPRSPEVIKNLQELDPSKWLDSPYLRQADEESLLTLLQRKPEGFKTLLNSSYSFIRDIVLRRDILITILKIRPHYIKLIPVKHLSERLFSIVNQAIEKDTDELSKKLLIDALDVAKQELSDYKDAQTMEIKENTSPSSSTQQDIKTPSDTGDETLPDTHTSPSDELEKPKEVSTEPKVNEESTEKPKEPIVEIETEKESISTKENNNNDIDNPSLDPIIQKVFMDASLGDFTKSLEQKIIANNVKTNQEIKELVTQHITQLSNNLTAQQQTLELLQQTLNEPSKALINRFSEESEKVSIRISEINTLLENQYNQAKELSTNFSIVLEKPTQDLYDSLEKEIIHQINNCIINESGIQLQVEEIKNKSIESIENSNQAVKDTANNLINALTTRYNQQKEIIEKANNFFDKKGLIQNITIIAVFVNLLLLFFIFITLLLRG